MRYEYGLGTLPRRQLSRRAHWRARRRRPQRRIRQTRTHVRNVGTQLHGCQRHVRQHSEFNRRHTGSEPPLPDSQSTTLLTPGALSSGPITGKLRKKPTTTGKKSLRQEAKRSVRNDADPMLRARAPKEIDESKCFYQHAQECVSAHDHQNTTSCQTASTNHTVVLLLHVDSPKQSVPRSFRRCEKKRS
jgi:hypothetical protein